jgi:DtxR family transcriptional regulator, manganese transport regulator
MLQFREDRVETLEQSIMTITNHIPDICFNKVRADHSTETAEDYVEVISDIIHRQGACRVKDLASHMGVSHVTIVRTIARLKKENLVTSEPHRPIRLTIQGEQLAAKSRRRHEIVLSFLLALGVGSLEASRDAEGMEHHVSPDTLERMKAFIAEHDENSKHSPTIG